MHSGALVQSMFVPLLLILLSGVEDSLLQSLSQGACRFSTESSQRRCRTPDGKICGGRGDCECGVCVCKATEPGKFFGPRCECHDWLCATHNAKACNDHMVVSEQPVSDAADLREAEAGPVWPS
ncbi:unnamed protein product [Arctogadus glacialis]